MTIIKKIYEKGICKKCQGQMKTKNVLCWKCRKNDYMAKYMREYLKNKKIERIKKGEIIFCKKCQGQMKTKNVLCWKCRKKDYRKNYMKEYMRKYRQDYNKKNRDDKLKNQLHIYHMKKNIKDKLKFINGLSHGNKLLLSKLILKNKNLY